MHTLYLHHLSINSPIKNTTSSPHNPPKNNPSKIHHPFTNENIFTDALQSLRITIDHKNPILGSCLHANTLKQGLQNDTFISNSLLNMYIKCGQINNASTLFDQMSHRTVVSWTSMMSGYCQKGFPGKALTLFTQMNLHPNEYTLAVLLQACGLINDAKLVELIHGYVIKSGFITDSYLQSCLLDAYVKCNMCDVAETLLKKFSCRDVVSWTTIISGYVRGKMVKRAFILFHKMQEEGVFPNEVTILSILQGCSKTKNKQILQWGHGLVLKRGWFNNILVIDSVIEMYCNNGYLNQGIKIFIEFSFCNEGLYLKGETIANLLHGLVGSGLFKIGKEIHAYLIKNGLVDQIVVENSLMNMYAENGDNDSSLLIFTRMKNKDIISWNTMIGCFVKNEKPSKALDLLSYIHKEGSLNPDFITILGSLQACSDLASLEKGQAIHSYAFKTGLFHDIFIQNAMIDTYAKSGNLVFAERIFSEMEERDIGSWNSMILAYGINGNGKSALLTFSRLKCVPNTITFVNILSACAHSGLVKEGLKIFNSMKKDYAFEPCNEHYVCIVDLLGRSGRINEAEEFIDNISGNPSSEIWSALLGACVLKSNVEVAKKAANMLSVLEPENSVWRVGLSNVYASVGRWDEVAKVRREIRESREGGWSMVDVKGRGYRFMVGDTRHPESKLIYEIVDTLQNQLRDVRMDRTLID